MSLELVPRCIPFLSGCTSISATGRYAPASFVFKGLLLPYCTLLAVYWWCVVAWLEALPVGRWGAANSCRWLALTSCAALAVYTVLLGSEVPAYEFMRRFGIYFFFLFTVIAQILSGLRLRAWPPARRAARWQLALAAAMLASGFLNLILKSVLADPDNAENIIEWNFALLMFLNLLPIAGVLKRGSATLTLRSTQ